MDRNWAVQPRTVDAWCRRCAVLISVGVLPSGCGGTSVESAAEIPADCVGDYRGNFAGDARGTLTGNLGSSATFRVTFVQTSTGQSASGSGTIEEDGTIELVLGPNSVTGVFNFNQCRATGDWVAGETNGNWNATRR